MSQPEIVFGILAFITFSMPILTALFRLFAVREKLETAILDNQHRLNLQEQQLTHLLDQQTLFLRGLDERLQHVRDRSQEREGSLHRRLLDLEAFTEKSTSFERRRE